MVLQAVRPDALPEGKDHPDEGCDLYPRCLACPLPTCRYDVKGGVTTMRMERRRAAAIELRRQGVPVEEIANRLRVSRRAAFRLLEGAR